MQIPNHRLIADGHSHGSTPTRSTDSDGPRNQLRAPCHLRARPSRGPHARRSTPARCAIRSVITTIDPDRAGDIVVPTGLRNADEYLLNPSCSGRTTARSSRRSASCEWIDVQPRRIVAETRFARGRALRGGHLPALRAGRAPRLVDRLRAAQGEADAASAVRLRRGFASRSGTCSNTRRCRSPRTPARSRSRAEGPRPRSGPSRLADRMPDDRGGRCSRSGRCGSTNSMPQPE